VTGNYRTERRSASQNLTETFDLEGATALGGLNRLHRFLRAFGVERELQQQFGRSKAAWAEWPLDRVLRLYLDLCFAGLSRLFHYADLEREPLLCALYRVERLPDLTMLYRDLRRFEQVELQKALDDVLRKLVQNAIASQERVVLDIDSMVNTVYGVQEGAALGPNPHKPGRPSYHPLVARDRLSDLVVHHQFRCGDTGTATDVVPFLHRTIDIVREDGREREILARLDSGFESDDALSVLERRGVGYVVKMRATWELAHFATQLPAAVWTTLEVEGEGQMQITSIFWTRGSWSHERRVVVLRKREMDRTQGHIFDSEGWSYSLFVTDRDWAPEEVARFYDKRADVERTICELRNDLAIDHVPSSSFGANAADFALKILARNLLVLYRDRDLRLTTRERVMTLRRRFLLIAGRIVRHSGKLFLRLPRGHALEGRVETFAT
jgi:hypothetical protein